MSRPGEILQHYFILAWEVGTVETAERLEAWRQVKNLPP